MGEAAYQLRSNEVIMEVKTPTLVEHLLNTIIVAKFHFTFFKEIFFEGYF